MENGYLEMNRFVRLSHIHIFGRNETSSKISTYIKKVSKSIGLF